MIHKGVIDLYDSVCIFSVTEQVCHMLYTGSIFPGDTMNNNQDFPIDGIYKKKYWDDYDLFPTLYVTYVIYRIIL